MIIFDTQLKTALTVKSRYFLNLQGKRKFGSKNRVVREIGGKITVFE